MRISRLPLQGFIVDDGLGDGVLTLETKEVPTGHQWQVQRVSASVDDTATPASLSVHRNAVTNATYVTSTATVPNELTEDPPVPRGAGEKMLFRFTGGVIGTAAYISLEYVDTMEAA